MKIKTLVLSVATAATGVGLLIGPAGVASAAVVGPPLPNSAYGFDGNAHLVVGGGSTTLYKIAQGFHRHLELVGELLHQQRHRSPGCHAPVLPRGRGRRVQPVHTGRRHANL